MSKFKINKGFTLIEVIVVIAIIAIMVVVAIPSFLGFTGNAKVAADQVTVRMLNNKTEIYRINNLDDDPFKNIDNSDNSLMNLLVAGSYIDKISEPRNKGARFSWSFDKQIWFVTSAGSSYIITFQDGFSIFAGNRLSGSYNGDAKNILIPASLNGTIIKEINQDVFRDKGLLEVSFDKGSEINRIHARAFYNNNLTKVEFPNSLERIDLWSFRDNSLTEIKLPANIHTIEQHAFNGNDLKRISIGSKVTTIQTQALGLYTDQFKSAYSNGGAGTYVLIGGVWIKEE
jgi:prepilin-type N-terminal cleavage/methylation domain-containing protein